MNIIVCSLLCLLCFFSFSGCEDTPPTAYTEEIVVEAFLVVNKPIKGILLSRSLPITDTFSYEQSFVGNANIIVYSVQDSFPLLYRATERGGEYYSPDSTKIILPQTQYFLKISMPDGRLFSASTTTPPQISWEKEPKSVLQYPVDTIQLPSPDSLAIQWSPIQGVREYFLRLTCLDTLEYGRFLTPPTSEKNRRIVRFFDRPRSSRYRNVSINILTPGLTRIPVTWNAFRWFGRQEISAVAPDPHFIRWYKQRRSGNNFNALLSNVEGGAIGVFGSYSEVAKEIFLLKNQP